MRVDLIARSSAPLVGILEAPAARANEFLLRLQVCVYVLVVVDQASFAEPVDWIAAFASRLDVHALSRARGTRRAPSIISSESSATPGWVRRCDAP